MMRDSSPIRKWIVVSVIWLIACLNYTDRTAIFSVMPALKGEMRLSNIGLAMLGSTFLWVYALFSPVGGYLGDRFSRKRVIILSLSLFSVVTFVSGFARTGRELIELRCLLGVSEALFLPPALAYIASYHLEGTRSLANSIALSGLTMGAGLGSWYGGFMTDHYSWRLGFFWLGGIGLLVALLSMAILPTDSIVVSTPREPEFTREEAQSKIFAVFKSRTALSLIFLAFALSLTSWPTQSWLPTYFFENFKQSLTHAGSMVTVFASLPALIGGICGGILADRWYRRNVRARMALQVIGFSVMAPALLAIGFMPTIRSVATVLLLYSVARGMLEVNSMPVFCSILPANRWSMAYGLYNTAGTLAGSIGIFLVGAQKASWGIGHTLSWLSLALFAALAVTAYATYRFLPADIQLQAGRAREASVIAAQPLVGG